MNKLKITEIISKLIGASLKTKIIAGAVAVVTVAGGTTTAVIVHNNSVAAKQNNPKAIVETTPQSKVVNSSAETSNNTTASSNTASETANNAAQANTTASQPAAQVDPNQAKYDAAKAKAGSNLSELISGLKKLGYTVGADNTVDAATYNAILKFQSDNGLESDGLPGGATIAKIEAKLNPAETVKTQSTTSGSAGTTQSSSTTQASSAVVALPSPSEIEAEHSDGAFRSETAWTSEVYSQLDNIYNNFLSNHDATAGTNAMYAIHLNIQDNLYTNIHVTSGKCGSAVLKPGMSDTDIGMAIGSCAPGNNMYSKFKVVPNGDGTDTVYRLACYVTHD